ncbi:MAG: hypothetical protein H0X73_04465 [Chthoniobacterales bacterium]|nr:hypothetical protein [Chthoniobacterales bacterium]
MLAAAANATVLRVFFSVLLVLILAVGFFVLQNRKKFFTHTGDASDSYASADLRRWRVILVWIHAVIITTLMIFEV